MTDYTDPSTVDVEVVIANINRVYGTHGCEWDDRPIWPHVTVLALAQEVMRTRTMLRRYERAVEPASLDDGFWLAYYGDGSAMAAFSEEVEALRYAVDKSMMVKHVEWGDLHEQLREPHQTP